MCVLLIMFGNHQSNFSNPWNQNANYGMNVMSFDPMYCHSYQYNSLMYSEDNSSQDKAIAILNKRKADKEFLKHFIDEAEEPLNYQHKVNKISETKSALITVNLLNKKLMKMSEELKTKDISEKEWLEKRNICEETKEKIRSILYNLKSKEYLKSMKKNFEKRKKKRLREKRLRKEWKEKKVALKEKRTRLHNEADNWIKGKQNIIYKEKQEENLRKEADLVLFDVRAKRCDAKKYLTLLKELENLRRIKVTIAKARGGYISSAADDAFNNIIGKLTQQWTALDREYSLEEQGLKLMIKTDNESKFEKQKLNSYDSWEIALFSKKLPNDYFLQGDINNFITIRSAWDKFLNANEGTPIPVGWIVPNKPSSYAWQKYLKKE